MLTSSRPSRSSRSIWRTCESMPWPCGMVVNEGSTIALTPARTHSVATRRCTSTEADGIAMITCSALVSSAQWASSVIGPSTL